MAPPVPSAPHAEELSRKMSELDLTSIQATKDTLPEYRPVYSRDELLNLRQEIHDGHTDAPDFKYEGVMTPASPPNAPPSTPADKTPGQTQGGEEGDGLALAAGEQKKKKKKKKKKSNGGGKSKKTPATGFEEFYADPPMTPDEHEEESDLYDSCRPFHERIQTCIQRYRFRRKLDETRNLIITKFLMLGGVEAASTKSFTGGLDKETVENSTAAEIAAIQATDFIRTGGINAKYYDPAKPDGWVVDFEGVTKGFFSHTAPRHIGDFDKQISTYCAVVKNFLNYVLSHAICPEYTNDVLAARSICDLAEKELIAINHLRKLLPGDFNVAASSLYGGRYQGIYLSSQKWGAIDPLAKYVAVGQGFSEFEAQRIFKTAIALSGTEKMFKGVMGEDVEIVRTEKRYFEVVKIERPDPETIALYADVKNAGGEISHFKALGRLHVKAWDGPGYEEEDISDDEDNGVSTAIDSSVETFWLEHDILNHFLIGLKMEIIVHELNIGIKFFDYVASLYCSFHTYLPNEKMNGWKEPNLNTRASPTEEDPEAEEGAMMGHMEKDIEEDEKLGKKIMVQTNLEESTAEPKTEVTAEMDATKD